MLSNSVEGESLGIGVLKQKLDCGLRSHESVRYATSWTQRQQNSICHLEAKHDLLLVGPVRHLDQWLLLLAVHGVPLSARHDDKPTAIDLHRSGGALISVRTAQRGILHAE